MQFFSKMFSPNTVVGVAECMGVARLNERKSPNTFFEKFFFKLQ